MKKHTWLTAITVMLCCALVTVTFAGCLLGDDMETLRAKAKKTLREREAARERARQEALKEILDKIRGELVLVPGGSFEMGNSNNDYDDWGYDTSLHTVTVTGFYMGKYEVTQEYYQAVMRTNPSKNYGVGNNYPVYNVSWYDAVEFCNKLSELEGLQPVYTISGYGSYDRTVTADWNANGYRLPTEAEWEYAARGGDGSPGNYTYAGSNEPSIVAWYGNNSGYTTHEVGTKAPNGRLGLVWLYDTFGPPNAPGPEGPGLYDMSGNVSEWCWDWYGDYSSEAQTDPAGASWGEGRVVRGGSWNDRREENIRSASRDLGEPFEKNNNIGFRLVRPGISEYTVSFDVNGGNGIAPPTQTNFRITLPSGGDLDRNGYIFGGWNTNADGTGTNYNAGNSYTPTGDITLYAKWNLAYTVAFSANGGNGLIPAQKVETGSSITLPGGSELSQYGYVFVGWNTDAYGNGNQYNAGDLYTPASNITLYARWIDSADTCTVTFNANGGSGTVPPMTVIAGSNITLPSGSGLSQYDYIFAGWKTHDYNSGTTYFAGYSYTVNSSVTLYAEWIYAAGACTVTFNANGGSGTAPPITVSAYSNIILPDGSGLSRNGYVVGGWSTSAYGGGNNYNAGSSYMIYGDVTFYAQWVAAYTVTFDANGGSGTPPAAQTVRTGSSIILPGGSGLSRSGYGFIGWNTALDGTGTNYNTGSSYTVTGNVTLYAKWYSIVLEMVFVPGGSFQMGQNLGSGGGSNVTPVHTVTLTSGFYMGKYEVTQEQYQAVMGSNPSNFSGNNLPVECVSWYDALVFCNKLSMMEGLTPAYRINNSTDPAVWGTSSNSTWNAVTIDSNATGYRLPTEAQWEYAAKGGATGETFTYAGSDTVGDVAWYTSNSSSRTHEVGTKSPNGLDLYDMSGNVWEWCWDWYGTYPSGEQTDPTGASSGSDRVLRGGSWDYSAESVRSASRGRNYPYYRDYSIGFRLVRP